MPCFHRFLWFSTFILSLFTGFAWVVQVRHLSVKCRHRWYVSNAAITHRAHQSDGNDQDIGIGIDLGTTNSAVAYLKDGHPTIIPIPGNGRTMPSIVALGDQDGTYVVGAAALEQDSAPPYANVKRVMGTGGKISAQVREVVPHLILNTSGKTYKKDNMENQMYDAQHYPTVLRSTIDPTKTIRPEEISSAILRKLKTTAEQYTGCRVSRAVIGVPAYFNDAQREATVQAAQASGIEKVKLLREPEAAALAYGIGKDQIGQGEEDELVLAFDLGGGTFDVSMLIVGGGVSEIISTSGDSELGGADFDGRIAHHLKRILSVDGVAVRKFGADAQNAIVQASERIRIHLSNNRKASLRLPTTEAAWLSMSSAGQVLVTEDSECTKISNDSSYIACQITRREMERLCKDELQALLRPVREVAIMSGALLPGDTSPTLVETALEMEEWSKEEDSLSFGEFYLDEDNETSKDILDTDTLLQLEEAALKAAKRSQQKGRKRARNLAKEERKFREEKKKVAETSTATVIDGIKVQDGITGRPISRVVLVGGATRMPAVGRLIAALTGITPQKTVNPDEAVALGCAANVGVLDGLDGMGKVLNPMQAAILRAMAEQQGMFEEDFDDADFDEIEFT